MQALSTIAKQNAQGYKFVPHVVRALAAKKIAQLDKRRKGE